MDLLYMVARSGLDFLIAASGPDRTVIAPHVQPPISGFGPVGSRDAEDATVFGSFSPFALLCSCEVIVNNAPSNATQCSHVDSGGAIGQSGVHKLDV